ncbi:MAG: hypothetical protein COU69_01665 [Candidatus Pacebacteria bacterium CG10_big_fil_rev_8_21_14_0_10_56_10]|nr:MAG: hypothetical protein COU69_01665 [Candidatus Pacebacteria bacterium CG10_big_fil_rev_8_21_14_0_10_56_10]
MATTTKPKTVAIYDRWLSSLGGGEQVVLAYAQVLRDLGYNVNLLTHRHVNRHQLEKKMGVSLKQIKIVSMPESDPSLLSGVSERYDIFINASHLDYFANRSRQGLISVFFPGIIKMTIYEYLKRALFIPSFKKAFIYPTKFEGFSHDQYLHGRIHKWLGKRSTISFNTYIDKVGFQLYFRFMTLAVIDGIEFFRGSQRVEPLERSVNQKNNVVTYRFSQLDKGGLTIVLPSDRYSQDIAMISFTIPSVRYLLFNVFKRFFPRWEMRLHGGPGITKRADLESYQTIVTISKFCRKWINRYWGLSSRVLYPPVNTSKFFHSKPKKNIIIHVGRFFVTGHSKKQLELVKAFKKLVTHHNVSNWQLHFVGSVELGKLHQQYFRQVRSEAHGFPVKFHTRASFQELRNLFASAKIYWHATGLDENEEKRPIAFEHFGITTVEAMASGCVPVVINAGGQREIVTKDSGFTWNTRAELINYTLRLIKSPQLLKQYQRQAVRRSRYFDIDNFKKRFTIIIKG